MSKIAITLSLLFCVFTNLKAQVITDPKIKEYYFKIPVPLTFSLIPINFEYKKQKKNNTFYKVGLFSLSSQYNKDELNQDVFGNSYFGERKYLSGGINIGLEFRKSLSDHLTFFHGPNLGLFYSLSTFNPKNNYNTSYTKTKQENYSISLPYTLGLLFNINKHLLMAAQINPSIYISQDNNNNMNQNLSSQKSQSIGVGFNNQLGNIAIVYRR